MAISNTARILIVAVVVAVIVVVVLMFRADTPDLGGEPGLTDVETEVVLDDDDNGRCKIITKEDEVTAKANRKLTWNINEDACDYKDEVVTVGNFRYSPTSSATDCKAAVEGNTVWPFVEREPEIKHRQNTRNPNKIELHVRPSADLPGTGPTVSYYYDICTGVNADVKSDPMLVIEK